MERGKIVIVLGLLAIGLVASASYISSENQIYKVDDPVDAPALALALGGEITSLNAQADAEYARYEAELVIANELKVAADEIRGKYPNAAEALDRAYEDRLVEIQTIEGRATEYAELASEKEAELNALNAAMLGQAPKGE